MRAPANSHLRGSTAQRVSVSDGTRQVCVAWTSSRIYRRRRFPPERPPKFPEHQAKGVSDVEWRVNFAFVTISAGLGSGGVPERTTSLRRIHAGDIIPQCSASYPYLQYVPF